jgi:DNA polymerase-3 subunit gamma/tau
MTTLYRKYRPQTFADTVGQNYIKIILEHQIATDNLAHAYLFCGPRAVGKTTLARVVSKAVNCLNRQAGQAEPCGICEACVEIAAGRALDIIEMDAASHTSVDNVRENIIANARVAPVKLQKKVFIIDEAHMLSTAAFNALLKTLEEPPSNVLFILCTTEIHKLPLTIISRCQRFDFKRISLVDSMKKLQVIVQKEGIEIDKKILESVARQADGHMRDAESLLGQLLNVSGKKITEAEASLVIPRNNLAEVIALLQFIAQKEASSSIRLINKLLDEGVDLKVFVTDTVEILRKILFLKISPDLIQQFGLDLGEQLELKLTEMKNSLSHEQIIYLIENLTKAREEMKQSFIIQLPLELVIMKIAISGSAQATRPIATAETVSAQSLPVQVAPIVNSADVSIDEVVAKWQEFLLRLKKYNHSLSFILRVCEPRKIQGGEVCLAFKYKFHKDRVSDPNIKALIEKVLLEVHGAHLTIEAIIDENMSTDTASVKLDDEVVVSAKEEPPIVSVADAPMIDDLLKTFGGKIVG